MQGCYICFFPSSTITSWEMDIKSWPSDMTNPIYTNLRAFKTSTLHVSQDCHTCVKGHLYLAAICFKQAYLTPLPNVAFYDRFVYIMFLPGLVTEQSIEDLVLPRGPFGTGLPSSFKHKHTSSCVFRYVTHCVCL